MMPYGVGDHGQYWLKVMACCLTAPSHYLNQCWFIINCILWQLPDNNLTGNAQDITPWNKFEHHNLKITHTSPMEQWVNSIPLSHIEWDIICLKNIVFPEHPLVTWRWMPVPVYSSNLKHLVYKLQKVQNTYYQIISAHYFDIMSTYSIFNDASILLRNWNTDTDWHEVTAAKLCTWQNSYTIYIYDSLEWSYIISIEFRWSWKKIFSKYIYGYTALDTG